MTNVRWFDDVLPDEAFRAFHRYAEDLEKRPSIYGTNIWEHNDENPFESRLTFWSPATSRPQLEQSLPGGVSLAEMSRIDDVAVSPTSTAHDAVLAAIAERASLIAGLVGAPGEDWVAIASKVYAYPCRAKANWHTDSGPYSGAFVFYAHDAWDKNWGGQFLFGDEQRSKEVAPHEGHFLTPIPNRLVVIKSGTPHMVANVSAVAGARSRLSLAGFFVRPDGVQWLVQHLQQAMNARRLRDEQPT
jgi:hypothetical protein